jgi:hypothetical protein
MFSFILADEGMWLMSQIKDLDLKSKGFEISAEEIYDEENMSLHKAIVSLGGCSGAFVSPEGLILTNHHCAYGFLQKASARDGKDYIKEGFLAKAHGEELPLPGQNAYLLQSSENVTKEIYKASRRASDPTQREFMIEKKIRDMIEKTEENDPGIYCKVVKVFEGRDYIKYTYSKYQDVRIVYAPPESIGKYGGDIDNWMWPRHTGDFTFYRVYQSPEGKPAEYSPDNVPLLVSSYLKIAEDDLKASDPAFIIGFPGVTTRYRTVADIKHTIDHVYLPRIEDYKDYLEIIDNIYKKDPKAKLLLASKEAAINNYMKKYQGNLDGFATSDFIANQEKEEKKIRSFIDQDRDLKKRFIHVLPEISELLKEKESYHDDDKMLNAFGYDSGQLYYIAQYAYETAMERQKPAADRDPDFSEKRVKEYLKQLPDKFYSYHEGFDKACLKHAINKASELKKNYYIDLPDNPSSWVENAYRSTKLSDPNYVQRLFSLSVDRMEGLNDPIMQLAISLYAPKLEQKQRHRHWTARMNEVREQYMELLAIYKNTPQYPDATGTMRFTYGKIEGYSPKDAIYYQAFSTLSGLIDKNTGKEPFNMPKKLANLSDKEKWLDPELNDVPVCFLLDCDITNGNSGSSIMNAKGELVGLAFDGNYEAMTSDWMFQAETQRTIAVDIRYILFITKEYAGGDWILKEMSVK